MGWWACCAVLYCALPCSHCDCTATLFQERRPVATKMSQPAIHQFFKARRGGAVPEQQAAKRRKIVLQDSDIKRLLLDNDNELCDTSDAPEPDPINEKKAVEDEEPVYCVCRGPDDGKRFMISCDYCVEWYHGDCIGVKEEEADNIEKFYCNSCIEKNKYLSILHKSEYNNEKENVGKDSSGTTEKAEVEGKSEKESVLETPDRSELDENQATPIFPKILNNNTETAGEVVTSAVDNHSVLAGSLLATPPSTAKRENCLKRKIGKREEQAASTPRLVTTSLFTIGNSDRSVPVRRKRNVVFTKRGSLSTTKQCGESNKQPPQLSPPTPSKARKSLFLNSPDKQPDPAVAAVKEAIQDAKQLAGRLSKDEVKQRLGRVKLTELRGRLASLENSRLKAAAARVPSPRKIPPTRPGLVDLQAPLPASPHKQSGVETVEVAKPRAPPQHKASPRKVPAYQRYHSLARPVDRTLPLPHSHLRLLDLFRDTDTIIAMAHNKGESLGLGELAGQVRRLQGRRWDTARLQQIICVFPQAYRLTWVRPQPGRDKELRIAPNMRFRRDLLEQFHTGEETFVRLSPELQVERKEFFRNALLELVKDHHEEFLASLDPPITAARDRLTKWHKDFCLDSVPEIECASLGGPTEDQDKVQDNVGSKERKTVGGADWSLPVERLQSPVKAVADSTEPGLAGLSPALVAKVRAREAAQQVREMTRTKQQLDRIATLKKLPGMARLLR